MRKLLFAALALACACASALGQAVSSVGTISSNQLSLFTDNKHIKGAVMGAGFSYDGTTITAGVGTNASIVGINGVQVNGPNWTNTSTMLWSNTGTNIFGFPTNLLDAQISSSAAITRSKIAAGTANHIVINDAGGLLSSEATLGATRFPALTGDVTTPGGSLATTLATVNGNVGTFTNATITVNGKGLITAASSAAEALAYKFGSQFSQSGNGPTNIDFAVGLIQTNNDLLFVEGDLGTIAGAGTATLSANTNSYRAVLSGTTFTIDLPASPSAGRVVTKYFAATNSSVGTQVGTVTIGGGAASIKFPWGYGNTITNASGADVQYLFFSKNGAWYYCNTIGDAYNPAGGAAPSGNSTSINGSTPSQLNFTNNASVVFALSNTNGTAALASGVFSTNQGFFGPLVFTPSGTDSTNINWSAGQASVQGISTNATFTNTFSGAPPSSGGSLSYVVYNSASTNIDVIFSTTQAIGTNNFDYGSATTNLAKVTVAANSRTTFSWFYDGNRYYIQTIAKASAAAGGTSVYVNATNVTAPNFKDNWNAKFNQSSTTNILVVPPVPADLTDAATVATDASTGSRFRVTLAGNRTLGNPTNPTDRQELLWEVIQDGTGNRTLAMDTKFAFGTDITGITLTTNASKRDFIKAIYDQTADKFYVIGFTRGY